MPSKATLISVFIASPGDVPKERLEVVDVLRQWNIVHAHENACVLQDLRWETHAVPEFGDRPQAIINRQLVDKADILIGIFGARLGSPTGAAESGTAEEIGLALSHGKPVVVYFFSRPTDVVGAEPNEIARLDSYRQVLQRQGLTASYTSLADLRTQVAHHLHHHVVRLLRHGGAEQSLASERPSVSSVRLPAAASVRASIRVSIAGRVDILDAFNVSSFTDLGYLDFSIVFATALSDENYVVDVAGNGSVDFRILTQTATGVQLRFNEPCPSTVLVRVL